MKKILILRTEILFQAVKSSLKLGARWGIFLIGFSACQQTPDTLFHSLDPQTSGIHFVNRIVENDTLNILEFEYVYNGGGVAIVDVNQDSLPDIFFTGNQRSNHLYLNKGNLQFQEIAKEAGVDAPEKWCSGVSIIDINSDGLIDFYVSATVHSPGINRANMLFVHQGINAQGIPVFKELAAEYGIADTGHSTHAAFLDMDLDGDLDLYVLTDQLDEARTPNRYRNKINDGSNPNTDRLYRNNGDNTFSNISKEAGIRYEGYGLGIAIGDINVDGWPDIYVANDYVSNDLLYINNRNGTFTNEISNAFKHQSHSAMGTDMVDINGDGLVDIMTLDMQPDVNLRQKALTPANNYSTYRNNERFGYDFQYVRNTLQLNQGFRGERVPIFSDISQLTGVYQTDWSWAPLIEDIDHDGKKDILITNGFPKDITDLDFGNYRSSTSRLVSLEKSLEAIPEVKISNYAFKQSDDLRFEDVTTSWGLFNPSFSNGAALGDLDNDGDLDYVVNNINDSAFVYINQYQQKSPSSHYLRINIQGEKPNTMGIGTKIILHYGNGQMIYKEFYPYRGYISSLEPTIHMGLGQHAQVDSVRVIWPDGRTEIRQDIAVDQVIHFTQPKADSRIDLEHITSYLFPKPTPSMFQEVGDERELDFVHEEDDKIDFNLQRTLPHKYSQMGPGMAVGDLDGNGLEDVVIGGSAGKAGAVYFQTQQGTFEKDDTHSLSQAMEGEVMGILLFDADQDQDLDAYVSFGSYEFEAQSELNQDLFYINRGNGVMDRAENVLPEMISSTACVTASDVDKDGDLDVFVGGRIIPDAYPLAPTSYLLQNDEGTFREMTNEVAEGLDKIGMVTDALWTDVDNDGWEDLMVVGEWMPITIFKNQEGTLVNITQQTGISENIGWWNSITSGDVDKDGDIDYIVGNLGLNTRYKGTEEQPLYVYVADFDENGSFDPIIACYAKNEVGEKELFPIHTRDDLIRQMQQMRGTFPQYAIYGKATIDEVVTNEMKEKATVYAANYMSSSYIENVGNGQFKMKPLPLLAQASPIYGMLTVDVNLDGHLDVLMVGNNHGSEIFTGKYDALNGMVLKGNGKGDFEPILGTESGFFVPGDAKALVKVLDQNGSPIYIASQNRDSLCVFYSLSFNREIATGTLIPVSFQAYDQYALIYSEDGKTQKIESSYGSSYLSQSSRSFFIPQTIDKVEIYDYQGNKRLWESSQPEQ